MTHLEAAPLRKRSAVRGGRGVEVKFADAVVDIPETLIMKRFLAVGKMDEPDNQRSAKKWICLRRCESENAK
jgi:hypothetical protein